MSKFRKLFKHDEGFTLIELLVVIAVLGILAAIAIPRIAGVRDEAEKSALRASALTFRNAMEMYYAKEGGYPDIDSSGGAIPLGDLADDTFGDLNITFSSDADVQVQSDITVTDGATDYTVILENSGTTFEVTVSSSAGVGAVTTQ